MHHPLHPGCCSATHPNVYNSNPGNITSAVPGYRAKTLTEASTNLNKAVDLPGLKKRVPRKVEPRLQKMIGALQKNKLDRANEAR